MHTKSALMFTFVADGSLWSTMHCTKKMEKLPEAAKKQIVDGGKMSTGRSQRTINYQIFEKPLDFLIVKYN